MSSTAQELVEDAAAMLRTAASEPQYRAVCSRAYFGAWHAAHNFHRKLSTPGSVRGASGRHEQLIQQLCNPMLQVADSNYALSRAIGRDLIKLREARVTADYHLAEDLDHSLAMKSANLATQIIRKTT
ncbi:hypothetical protein QCE63_29945 [Caballeronia sp. LZ065]|uniref:hypothetical protein n=1 Tax=Caballeronia sp. LZ065 TaxID=3038571 RepID=UPI0028578A7B|nr:hypothetical protein [Caballeronia sp. LZ065]MDR5783640.1 hypothetical protein [Caballeronia sp. LZ065]